MYRVLLSVPPSHTVGYAQQDAVVKWKCYIWDWAQLGSEGASKLHEMAQMPMVTILLYCLLPSGLYLCPDGGVSLPCDQLTEEKTQASFIDDFA